MFKFSKSTDESIQQSFIVELLEGIKTFDVELSSALAGVESVQCLDNFIIKELHAVGEDESSLSEVKEFLNGKLSGEIVFWEEDDIHEQVLMWKIHASTPAPNLDNEDSNNGGSQDRDDSGASNGEETSEENGEDSNNSSQEIKRRVKEKVEANKDNADKLYQLLMLLSDRYGNILKDIDEFL